MAGTCQRQVAFGYVGAVFSGNSSSRGALKCSARRSTEVVTHQHVEVRRTRSSEAYRSSAPQGRQQAFRVIFEDSKYETALSTTSAVCELPLLVFVPGLDGKPLAECQTRVLKKQYVIVSLCHEPTDRSSWEELVKAISPTLERLRSVSPEDITLVSESFGAALALRLVAAYPSNFFKRLVLLNPGTAVMRDEFLQSITSLLPLLKIDRTERVLYKAAAVFLFKVLLVREEQLAESSIPKDELPILRSVNIDEVPLDAMLHRVNLLKSFGRTFNDDCTRYLVKTPAVLIASGRDRLLKSKQEIERLARLLPNVEKKIILPHSGHAALLEKQVNLSSILESSGKSGVLNSFLGTALQPLDDEKFETAYNLGKQWFGPWRELVSPRVLGSEKLTNLAHLDKDEEKKPVLLVGNHGVFGILDLSIFFIELIELLGKTRVRSLAHSSHFEQYGDFTDGRWSQFVVDLGAVPASPRNFYKLLANGENILLFPGGAREVCRRRGEKNKVFWKREVDFVRPAAKFNAIIVPFSTIGADDSVDILLDGQELQEVPFLGSSLTQLVKDLNFSPENLMPLTSFPPRADRFYFKFHEPIDTARVDHRDMESCQAIYDAVKTAVETGINDLIAEREKDPNKGFLTRALRAAHVRTNGLRQEKSALQELIKRVMPTFDI